MRVDLVRVGWSGRHDENEIFKHEAFGLCVLVEHAHQVMVEFPVWCERVGA